MTCQFLKTKMTAMNREKVTVYSCQMGVDTSYLPGYCDDCTMNPDDRREE